MSEEFKFGTWYPIESAPKKIKSQNGYSDFVWLHIPYGKLATRSYLGWWNYKTNEWFWEEFDGPGDVQPSMWMPIERPAPPPSSGDRKPEDPSPSAAECLNQSLPSSPTVEGGE